MEGISAGKKFAERYDTFTRRMVYESSPHFGEALASPSALSERITEKSKKRKLATLKIGVRIPTYWGLGRARLGLTDKKIKLPACKRTA